MTDNRLIELHNKIADLVQWYGSGLTPITEFTKAIAEISDELTKDYPVGMLDPNSGLRFPPASAYGG